VWPCLGDPPAQAKLGGPHGRPCPCRLAGFASPAGLVCTARPTTCRWEVRHKRPQSAAGPGVGQTHLGVPPVALRPPEPVLARRARGPCIFGRDSPCSRDLTTPHLKQDGGRLNCWPPERDGRFASWLGTMRETRRPQPRPAPGRSERWRRTGPSMARVIVDDGDDGRGHGARCSNLTRQVRVATARAGPRTRCANAQPR